MCWLMYHGLDDDDDVCRVCEFGLLGEKWVVIVCPTGLWCREQVAQRGYLRYTRQTRTVMRCVLGQFTMQNVRSRKANAWTTNE